MNHGNLQPAIHSISFAKYVASRQIVFAALFGAFALCLANRPAVAQQSAINPQSLVNSDYPQPISELRNPPAGVFTGAR
jgi:hypothetical protein